MENIESINCPNCQIDLTSFVNHELNNSSSVENFAEAELDSCQSESIRQDAFEPQAENSVKEEKGFTSDMINKTVYRTAIISFIKEWFFISVSTIPAFFPIFTISLFLKDSNMSSLYDFPWSINLISWLGILSISYFSFRIAYTYMNYRYVIGENRIETIEGIISRNISSIQYRHVLSVDIDQTVLERFIDVGNIQLATAGTSEAEVVIKRILNPSKIQKMINKRIVATQV